MGSEGEEVVRQNSALAKQLSVATEGSEHVQVKRLTSKAQEDEWDKEIPEVGVAVGGARIYL